MSDRTVVFVCAHGAARSRIAAAWFNTDPPPGWRATTAAAQEPAPALNPRTQQLLAGLPAHTHLDHDPPRPLTGVGQADLTITIDCVVSGAHRWTLTATTVNEAMRDELRDRVTALTHAVKAGQGAGRS
jgi:protein-tyrosine-phosphatase